MTSQWLDLSQQSSNIIVLHILYIYQDNVVHDIFTATGSDSGPASISLEQTVTPVGGSGNSMFYDIKLSDYIADMQYPTNGGVLYLSQDIYDIINNVTKTAKIIRVLAVCGVFFSTSITCGVGSNVSQIAFAPIPPMGGHGADITNSIFCLEITSNTDTDTHPEPYKATVTIADYAYKSEVLTKTNTSEYTPTEDYHPATKKYVDENAGIGKDEVLTKTNTTEYTPTANYHPATKKYVDNKSNLKNADYVICLENNTRDDPFSPDANAVDLTIAGNITSEYSLNYLRSALNNKNNRYYRVRLSDRPITDGNGAGTAGFLEFLQSSGNSHFFLIHMFRNAVTSHISGYIDTSNNSYYATSFG